MAEPWTPSITRPPAPGFHWELEFPDGDWRGGVIYWARKNEREETK